MPACGGICQPMMEVSAGGDFCGIGGAPFPALGVHLAPYGVARAVLVSPCKLLYWLALQNLRIVLSSIIIGE